MGPMGFATTWIPDAFSEFTALEGIGMVLVVVFFMRPIFLRIDADREKDAIPLPPVRTHSSASIRRELCLRRQQLLAIGGA
jgi:hypothetical protein